MTNMETLFIGYPPCSTCKKAYKALQDLGIEATYRNIKEDNPKKEEIQSWIDRGVELKKLFNTSGMLYRELNVKEKRERRGCADVRTPGPAAAAVGGRGAGHAGGMGLPGTRHPAGY
mgnify:CR=1 FL=1